MKYILVLSILVSLSLQADYVKETSVVCSQAQTLAELKVYGKDHPINKGGLEIELWLMKHECRVIDKDTTIEVQDYTGKRTEVLKVLLKEAGETVYMENKGIQIEQPGQKHIIYKF